MPVLTSMPRLVRWVVVVAVVGAFATAVFQVSRVAYAAESAPEEWTATPFGPLGPADRDLLAKVRLAGLWEQPTGLEMQQRADNERVQEIGRLLAKEHAELDGIVRDAAGKLGVALPDQPSQEQQGWMREISDSSGPDYDKVAINKLRAAHGKVLPVISQVRSGTRNDVVRKLAVTAAEFVNRHHTYLESSGLVDFAALPEPSHTSGAGPHNVAASTSPNSGVGAVVLLAALLAIVGLFAFLRGSSRRVDQPLVDGSGHSRPLPGPHAMSLALAVAPEDRGPRHAARRW